MALLAIVIVGGSFGYEKIKLNQITSQIETLLIDTKARVENSISFDDDQNITYGDALKKLDESATRIDESIIELKKIDNSIGKEHQEKARAILLASRDLMRIQSRFVRLHLEGKGYTNQLEQLAEELTLSGSNSYSQSSLNVLRDKTSKWGLEMHDAGSQRILALSSLVGATVDAKNLFQEKSLINTGQYLATVHKLQELHSNKNGE